MRNQDLLPINEQDWFIESNLSGQMKLTGSYNKTLQGWQVRLQITDERLRQQYDYSEFVKLSETASKDEVLRAAICQITRWFGRVNDFWLPMLAEVVES